MSGHPQEAAAPATQANGGHAPADAGVPFPALDWTALNPARLWRDWIVKSEAQWSETVTGLLKDERVGDTLNRQLSEMQLAQRQFAELAQASLAAANMPSRSDIEALDERMGRLEDGLAQVAAGLSRLAQALAAAPRGAAGGAGGAGDVLPGRPARNRRPPEAGPVVQGDPAEQATKGKGAKAAGRTTRAGQKGN